MLVRKSEVIKRISDVASICNGKVESTEKRVYVYNSKNEKITFDLSENNVSRSCAVYLVCWSQEFLKG